MCYSTVILADRPNGWGFTKRISDWKTSTGWQKVKVWWGSNGEVIRRLRRCVTRDKGNLFMWSSVRAIVVLGTSLATCYYVCNSFEAANPPQFKLHRFNEENKHFSVAFTVPHKIVRQKTFLGWKVLVVSFVTAAIRSSIPSWLVVRFRGAFHEVTLLRKACPLILGNSSILNDPWPSVASWYWGRVSVLGMHTQSAPVHNVVSHSWPAKSRCTASGAESGATCSRACNSAGNWPPSHKPDGPIHLFCRCHDCNDA